MKEKPIDTHIYFPPAVFRAIKKKAAAERRSVSAEIVIAVEAHVKPKKENK